MFEKIKYEVQGSVAVISLNTPKQLNTLLPQTFRELDEAISTIEKDGSLRAVIVYGCEEVFCAGDNVMDADTAKLIAEIGQLDYLRGMQRVFQRLDRLKLPVIAAVAGYALGGGCELALACDFIVAADNLQIGLPEAKLGAIPCIGGTQRLPRRIGTARAKELMFTCDLMGAEEALRVGLVNHVVPKGHVLEEAMKLAEKIAKRAPIAVAMINTAVDLGMDMDLQNGAEIEARNMSACLSSADMREGLAAFGEKRPPVFKNR